MLHGNSRTTSIEFVDATFADGNPVVTFAGRAEVTSDSLCFHDDRLVDASSRFAPAAKLVSVDTEGALLSIDVPQATELTIDLFDITGVKKADVIRGEYDAGRYFIRFAWHDLPQGAYLLRVTTAEGETTSLKVVR